MQSLVAATDESIFFRDKGTGKHASSILAELIDFQDTSFKNAKSR